MARGETIGAAKLRQHVRQCLRCQAEMSRERRIQRELHSLNDQILDSIETIDRRPIIVRRQRSKVAGFCALGVALVLGLGSRPVRRLAARAS